MNWSGKMLVDPRRMLAELAKWEETLRTGVYVLAGADPDNSSRDMIYVGEGDNAFKRLASHDKDMSKEFWTCCVAIISKHLNLTKAHVWYLESRLIEKGATAGRAKISNGTTPPLPPMPEPDIADMEVFLERIELMLPVLGFLFFKPRPIAKISEESEAVIQEASPRFHYLSREASAIAQEIDGEFVVLKGSTALKEAKLSWTSYRGLWDQFLADGTLVDDAKPGLLRFTADTPFSSPSAGAAIVNAGNINGRTAWKIPETRQTYQDWHESRLPAEAISDAD